VKAPAGGFAEWSGFPGHYCYPQRVGGKMAALLMLSITFATGSHSRAGGGRPALGDSRSGTCSDTGPRTGTGYRPIPYCCSRGALGLSEAKRPDQHEIAVPVHALERVSDFASRCPPPISADLHRNRISLASASVPFRPRRPNHLSISKLIRDDRSQCGKGQVD